MDSDGGPLTLASFRKKFEQLQCKYTDQAASDAFQLYKNFEGLKLLETKLYVHTNGAKENCVTMSGTIPIKIHGQQYNIPVCLWLHPYHPQCPPIVYVTPTSDMVIHESQFVDHKGFVYLPYINEWRQGESDLTTLVQIMCMTFAEKCPVYNKGCSQSNPILYNLQQSLPQQHYFDNLRRVEVPYAMNIQEERSFKNAEIEHLKEVIKTKDKIIQSKERVIQANTEEIQRTIQRKDGEIQLIIQRKDQKMKEEVSRKDEEIEMLSANMKEIKKMAEIKNELVLRKEEELRKKNLQITKLQQNLESERNDDNFLLFLQDATGSDSWSIHRDEVRQISKKQIGFGAWGVVYSGKFRGEEVAIKQAHREILQHVSTIDTLKKEILIMAHIHHPNLIRFIGAVLDEAVERGQDTPIIITELLDMNLRDAYSREDIGRSEISIFRDVSYALHYLHQYRQPIIHRDVSAPNVLLQSLPNNLYRAKMSDFGSANIATQGRTAGVGAIIYCAPEMFPPTDVTTPPPPQTTRVDVFSYGILLLEVILKEMPTTEKRSAMLQRAKEEWETMYELIIHCTKISPSDRPTMADVLRKLPRQ